MNSLLSSLQPTLLSPCDSCQPHCPTLLNSPVGGNTDSSRGSMGQVDFIGLVLGWDPPQEAGLGSRLKINLMVTCGRIVVLAVLDEGAEGQAGWWLQS